MKVFLLIVFLTGVPFIVILQAYMGGNWYSVLHSYSLGIVFGIAAWALFLSALVLSCRLRVLERYISQDRLLVVHKRIASAGMLAGIMHAFFKLQFSREINPQLITGFIGAFSIVSISILSVMIMSRPIFVRFGIITKMYKILRGMISYSKMKFIHNGLPIALMIILGHILIAPSTEETLLRTYLIMFTGIPVLLLWVYHRFFRGLFCCRGKVSRIGPLSTDLFSVKISLNYNLNFIPGQFFYFRVISVDIKREEHPFTIASRPGKNTVELIIKKEGEWTHALSRLRSGTEVLFDGPYGRFNFSHSGPMLWVAGGVGITPFLSMLRSIDCSEHKMKFPCTLIWTTRTEAEMPYKQNLLKYSERMVNFCFIPVHTRQPGKPGRIDQDMISTQLNKLKGSSLWFCGSPSLRRTVFEGAMDAGLPAHLIHHEEFSVSS